MDIFVLKHSNVSLPFNTTGIKTENQELALSNFRKKFESIKFKHFPTMGIRCYVYILIN